MNCAIKPPLFTVLCPPKHFRWECCFCCCFRAPARNLKVPESNEVTRINFWLKIFGAFLGHASVAVYEILSCYWIKLKWCWRLQAWYRHGPAQPKEKAISHRKAPLLVVPLYSKDLQTATAFGSSSQQQWEANGFHASAARKVLWKMIPFKRFRNNLNVGIGKTGIYFSAYGQSGWFNFNKLVLMFRKLLPRTFLISSRSVLSKSSIDIFQEFLQMLLDVALETLFSYLFHFFQFHLPASATRFLWKYSEFRLY